MVCGNELLGCRVLTCLDGDAGPGGPILTGMRRSHIKSDEALLVHRVTVEPVSSEGPSP